MISSKIRGWRQCSTVFDYGGAFGPHLAVAAFFAIALRCRLLSLSARALPPAMPPSRAISERCSAVNAKARAGPPALPALLVNSVTVIGFFSGTYLA
jgi:hypothetical protein